MKLRRARSTTALLNEKPIEAWFEPAPRPEPAPTKCKPSCCKTPFGCGRHLTCPCHHVPATFR